MPPVKLKPQLVKKSSVAKSSSQSLVNHTVVYFPHKFSGYISDNQGGYKFLDVPVDIQRLKDNLGPDQRLKYVSVYHSATKLLGDDVEVLISLNESSTRIPVEEITVSRLENLVGCTRDSEDFSRRFKIWWNGHACSDGCLMTITPEESKRYGIPFTYAIAEDIKPYLADFDSLFKPEAIDTPTESPSQQRETAQGDIQPEDSKDAPQVNLELTSSSKRPKGVTSKNKTGDEFQGFTLIQLVERDKARRQKWLVECPECRIQTEAWLHNMKAWVVPSCGCTKQKTGDIQRDQIACKAEARKAIRNPDIAVNTEELLF
jgi:hypothetical protein